MYYKTIAEKLSQSGWTITEESHGGNLYQHYFKYDHPNDKAGQTIEIVCTSNNDGRPGRIIKMWQGGKPCYV